MTVITRVSYDTVAAAVWDCMAAADRGLNTAAVVRWVCKDKGWAPTAEPDMARLDGQVRRALGKLVTDGTVQARKVGWGRHRVVWVPTRVIEQREARQAEADRIRQEADAARQALAARFADAGYQVHVDAERVTFDRKDAERLLGQLY